MSSVLLVNLCIREVTKGKDLYELEAAGGSSLILTFTAMLSLLLGSTCGRRALLMLGFLAMSSLHLLIGTLHDTEHDQTTLVYMTAFLMIYATTLGPISWLYAAETLPDVGLGGTAAAFMGLSLVTSLLKDAFIVYPALHFLLAGVSIIGLIMVFMLVPETR